MKIRSMKRKIYARMWRDLFYGWPIGQFLGEFRSGPMAPLVQVFRDAAGIESKRNEDFLNSLLEGQERRNREMTLSEQPIGKTYLNMQDVAVSVPIDTKTSGLAKYTVIKKTSGEVVGEFDSLDDAQAVIDKAKKAKKAALALLNEDPVA